MTQSFHVDYTHTHTHTHTHTTHTHTMDPWPLTPLLQFSPWSIVVWVEKISPAIHPSLLRVAFLLSLVIVWNTVDFCIPLEDWSDLSHHRVLFSSSLDYYIYVLLANILNLLHTKQPSETLLLCAIGLFHAIWCVGRIMRETETGKRANGFLEWSEQTSNPGVKLVPQRFCYRHEWYLKCPVSKPTYSHLLLNTLEFFFHKNLYFFP